MEGVRITNLPSVNIENMEFKEYLNVDVKDHRFLWFSVKQFFDKHHVFPVIDFCVSWANTLLK